MQDAKEEIRARINIEDVIGEYVQLKRAGRNFKGLSPFTGEKTPSFYVSPDKNIWHDFSSNKGGDVFSFVMEVEGVDFRGAMDILAKKLALTCPRIALRVHKRLLGVRDVSSRLTNSPRSTISRAWCETSTPSIMFSRNVD